MAEVRRAWVILRDKTVLGWGLQAMYGYGGSLWEDTEVSLVPPQVRRMDEESAGAGL